MSMEPRLEGECLECLKNQCLHFLSVAIDPTLFKLSDKEEMHNVFQVWSYRLLLIQPFLNFQIRRKCIMYSKFSHIGHQTT